MDHHEFVILRTPRLVCLVPLEHILVSSGLQMSLNLARVDESPVETCLETHDAVHGKETEITDTVTDSPQAGGPVQGAEQPGTDRVLADESTNAEDGSEALLSSEVGPPATLPISGQKGSRPTTPASEATGDPGESRRSICTSNLQK